MPRFDVPWDDEQILILRACSLVACSLSLMGALYIIIRHLLKQLRKSGYFGGIQSDHSPLENRFDSLVFFLSLAHCLNDLTWIVSIAAHESKLCKFTGPIILYFFLSSFCWTSFIATEIAYRFSHTTVTRLGERVIPVGIPIRPFWYHLIGWGVPAIFSAVPAGLGEMGIGVWTCWFNDAGDYWNFIFIGIVLCVLLYCMASYLYAFYRFQQAGEQAGEWGEEDRTRNRALGFQFTAYLAVFIICWMPGLMTSIVAITDPPNSTAVLVITMFGSFFMPLGGFLDSIVYSALKISDTPGLLRCLILCCNCRWSKIGYLNIEHENTNEGVQAED